MKSIWLLLLLCLNICQISKAQNGILSSKLLERHNVVYQVNSEVPYTGATFELYTSGQKRLEGSYLNGIKNGKWINWFENGQKEFEGSFLNGIKNGKWISWFKNGQKEFEGNFKNGEYDGRILKWQNSGQVIENQGYIKGILNGKSTIYVTTQVIFK